MCCTLPGRTLHNSLWMPTTTDNRAKRALLIGIDGYPFIAQLQGCVNDVRLTRAGSSSRGTPLTVSYLKSVPCKGYRGPTTAEQISPARFAVGAQLPPEKPEVGAPTRLEDVAC